MQFALVGNSPDGLQMARALLATGRHDLKRYVGPTLTPTELRGLSNNVLSSHDLEEALADPDVDAIIIASPIAERAQQLRRALQSERHVLCAHPPAPDPDAAYEASLIRGDVKHSLLPLLPETFHPALWRMRDLLVGVPSKSTSFTEEPIKSTKFLPLGQLRLVEVERWSTAEVLFNADAVDLKLCFPGWDVLRILGGQIAEVSALTPKAEVEAGTPTVVLGRFANDTLFEVRYVPWQRQSRYRIKMIGSHGESELMFPLGEMGPALLTWTDEQGDLQEEYWDHNDPWPSLVTLFENEVQIKDRPQDLKSMVSLSWEDTIRNLELDAAARRSAQRRRTVTMEYPEAGEDINFKSTMTLVGCGILWGIILLAILAQWVPELQWVVAGLLFVFLVSQMLRWVIPAKEQPADE